MNCIAGMYCTGMCTSTETPTFHTGLNTGQFRVLRPILDVLASTKKAIYLFIYFLFLVL